MTIAASHTLSATDTRHFLSKQNNSAPSIQYWSLLSKGSTKKCLEKLIVKIRYTFTYVQNPRYFFKNTRTTFTALYIHF